jgi:hypothetical protein
MAILHNSTVARVIVMTRVVEKLQFLSNVDVVAFSAQNHLLN